MQEVNPDTKILIYGAMPRVYWALMSNNEVEFQRMVDHAEIIAPLFKENPMVEVWPSAYMYSDNPDIYRLDSQWQIDICHRVYKTKCYFAIMPHYRGRADSSVRGYIDTGTKKYIPMDRNSFLGKMRTLVEDGADGVGFWIHPNMLRDNYETHMAEWSMSGGAMGLNRDKDLVWLSAVEKFLDEQMIKADAGTVGAGKCVIPAAHSNNGKGKGNGGLGFGKYRQPNSWLIQMMHLGFVNNQCED
jgi:hypothetical protein